MAAHVAYRQCQRKGGRQRLLLRARVNRREGRQGYDARDVLAEFRRMVLASADWHTGLVCERLDHQRDRAQRVEMANRV
jgi:hypothetical protein